jgi:hypothetical protein
MVNWTSLLQSLELAERQKNLTAADTPDWTQCRTMGLTELVTWLTKYGPIQATPSKSILEFRMPGAAKHDVQITRVSSSEWQVYQDYMSD